MKDGDNRHGPPVDTAQAPAGKFIKRRWPAYYHLFLMLLPVLAGGMAFWAMLNLQTGNGIGEIFKALLIGLSAGLVSFGINKTAIDWGTDLAASGSVLAGVFSIVSILVVGLCLGSFTYAGIVQPDVAELELEDHGAALVGYVDAKNAHASQAERLVPVIRAARDNLAHQAGCEVTESCVSGRGNGGRGPVARVLEEKAIRAGDIAGQVEAGLALRESTRADLNDLLGAYQTTLNDRSKSLLERRQALTTIDAQIGQKVATLGETIPVPLLVAYADELKAGVSIPARPEASAAVNGLLRRQGQALQTVSGTLEGRTIERPVFPAKTGIAATFSYIGHFIAIAGVVLVAEGLFPLALWIYTLLYLVRLQQQAPPSPPAAESRPRDRPRTSKNAGSRTGMNGGTHVE